jgi:hypothetical protein
MADLLIPVDSDAEFYDLSVDLDGRSYTFEVRWNTRAGAWFLATYDGAGELLVAPRRVVLGANLLGRGSDPRLPPGVLLAVDTSPARTDAGRTDLGTRVVIVYSEAGA